MQTKTNAIREARKLKKMLGKKWVINIHENLGWWYSVSSPCGRITVNPSYFGYSNAKPETFYCMITCSDYQGVGDPGWYSGKHYKNPYMAVKESIRVFKEQLLKRQRVLDIAEGLLK